MVSKSLLLVAACPLVGLAVACTPRHGVPLPVRSSEPEAPPAADGPDQAAAVSGRWVAQVPGRGGQTREMVFTLAAKGNTLTGTVSGIGGESPVSDGTINGDRLSFSTTVSVLGSRTKLLFKGTVVGGEIRFAMTREGEDSAKEFTAKQVGH